MVDPIGFAAFEKELRSRFGFGQFRPGQEAALRALAEGRDALVLMPTGQGKSLCFQLPAAVWPGLTLVISPLIALMEDQLHKAKKLGLAAAALHSGMSREARTAVLSLIEAGQVSLLFATPERWRKEEFRQALAKQKVRLLAIDEAHCISQWGFDFRPDYSRLGEVRRALGHPQLLALTATATPRVQADILTQLECPNAVIVREGLERPNLFLSVQDVVGQEEKVRALVSLRHQHPGAGIVYFALIQTLEETAVALRKLNIRFTKYHGQLPDNDRHRQQRAFLSGESQLMLATPAFGLGVDKADVRWIAHHEPPGSLEAYYQEVGRAGRDGKPATGVILYDPDDISIQMDFIKWANPEPGFLEALVNLLAGNLVRVRIEGADYLRAQLNFHNRRDFRLETALNLLDRAEVINWPQRDYRELELLGPIPDALRSRDTHAARLKAHHERLLEFVRWLSQDSCRKQTLRQYFGLPEGEPCGQCDNCAALSEGGSS